MYVDMQQKNKMHYYLNSYINLCNFADGKICCGTDLIILIQQNIYFYCNFTVIHTVKSETESALE